MRGGFKQKDNGLPKNGESLVNAALARCGASSADSSRSAVLRLATVCRAQRFVVDS